MCDIQFLINSYAFLAGMAIAILILPLFFKVLDALEKRKIKNRRKMEGWT